MITRRRAIRSLLLAVALVPVAAHAQPKPGHLDEVIRQMDAASLKFQTAEADFRWDLYELVVKETSTQTGTIYFKRDNGKTFMGARITSPGIKFIEYRNGGLQLYDPGTDHLTTVTSRNQDQMESFLTLGFGGGGHDLLKAWQVTDLGDETLDGVQTAKLDLVPRDPAVRNNCTHMTIWVDPARGITLKQSFYMPSGDYRTAVYTNIRYNQRVDEHKYQFKTTSKTTTDQH